MPNRNDSKNNKFLLKVWQEEEKVEWNRAISELQVTAIKNTVYKMYEN